HWGRGISSYRQEAMLVTREGFVRWEWKRRRSMQRRQRRMGPIMNELIEITNGGDLDSAAQTIYTALAKHQRDEAWGGQEMVAGLQTWAARFIVEFKLDIGDIALCI